MHLAQPAAYLVWLVGLEYDLECGARMKIEDVLNIIDSWERVAALFIIVVGVLLWRNMAQILSVAKSNRDRQDEIAKISEEIKRTLTESNSGSHVKDQLDRIEKVQQEQGNQLTATTMRTSDVAKVIDDNRETFIYMRDNFKDNGYFQVAEKRHDSHEARLAKLESRLKKRESRRWPWS